MASEGSQKRVFSFRNVAIIFIILLIMALVIGRWLLVHAVSTRVAAIRAAGYPASLDELDAWYEAPPFGENAAEQIGVAQKYLISAPFDAPVPGQTKDADFPPRNKPIPEEALQASRAFLESNADALAIARDALASGKARWPIDLTVGVNVDLPHLAQVRNMARIFALDATVEASTGNIDKAVEAITNALRLSHTLDNEPILISQFVRIACAGIGRERIEWLLNNSALTEPQLAALQDEFGALESSEPFLRGLAGELCMSSSAMQSLVYPGGQGGGVGSLPGLLYSATGIMDAELCFYLDASMLMTKALELPLDEQPAAAERIRAQVDNIPPYCVHAAVLMPALGRSFDSHLRSCTEARLVRTALAVERYRLAKGALPESLEVLVPEFLESVPRDLFGEGPVKYRKTDTGYMIYSVGEDREDDGGLEFTRETNEQKAEKDSSSGEKREKIHPRDADLTFVVERPDALSAP